MAIRPTHFGSYYKFTNPVSTVEHPDLLRMEKDTPPKESFTLEYDLEDPLQETVTGITCATKRNRDAEEAMGALGITWEETSLLDAAKRLWREVVEDRQMLTPADDERHADHLANVFLQSYGEEPLARPAFTAFG